MWRIRQYFLTFRVISWLYYFQMTICKLEHNGMVPPTVNNKRENFKHFGSNGDSKFFLSIEYTHSNLK